MKFPRFWTILLMFFALLAFSCCMTISSFLTGSEIDNEEIQEAILVIHLNAIKRNHPNDGKLANTCDILVNSFVDENNDWEGFFYCDVWDHSNVFSGLLSPKVVIEKLEDCSYFRQKTGNKHLSTTIKSDLRRL